MWTGFIQTPKMDKNQPKNTFELYQGLSLEDKVKYIGRGDGLSQGSEDFRKLWDDNTFTKN